MSTLLGELTRERVRPETEHRLLVCGGIPCSSKGCREVKESLDDELRRRGIAAEIPVEIVGCIGDCSLGPAIIVYPEGILYQKLTPDDARTIVREHLVGGRVVEALLHRDPRSDEILRQRETMPFYCGQTRLVLRNCGVISAHIDDYLKYRGYAALARALTEMSPQEVIGEVKASGLRGRGGGGFPTGRKWKLVRETPADEKFVICNADEGDPGAFMDRNILEGDPHSIIEGMLIAGYATGARRGYIYVRAEYPIAVHRCREAIRQARRKKLLGENILEKGFSFDLEIRTGAGAFVCGEETALISSLHGTRGDPEPRPPFPAQKGLWGKPTLINNVETLANIPLIILHGAGRFVELGPEGSPGTKVFALAGKVRHTGLVEVPLGTTLRQIIYDIGGGIPGDKRFKAAQTGGPSGGCLGEESLDRPMDYDSLRRAGSIIGSGGLIVMDEDSCMVDLARFYLDFNQDESCGKCTPCRIGSKRMLELLQGITGGRGEEGDLERLEQLALLMKNSSLCGLGRTAPNPLLSTLRIFRDEYLAHIRERRCPAGACRALSRQQGSTEEGTRAEAETVDR
ncbi:MAG TPA: NADH-quinone oxidoreductase subunit F [Firmicutes bacterium]|jgi:NADH:ubiquinone oxidoreductase subunit F (NADH-binding)/(2Fe-2S) ferredoxin|nr:NADH-quinone oxidoreductase subunit F [Bacillota bacterium]